MRLVESGPQMFEVHNGNRKVGRVWWYDEMWRAETNAGTAVPTTAGTTAAELGRAVVKLHKAGY